LEDKARQNAVNMAKEKANSMAKATGIKLGRIVDVQESSNFIPRPVMMTQSLDNAKMASTELQSGENSITIDVTLSYETL